MKKILAVVLVVLVLGSITVFAMGFNQRDTVIGEGYEDGFGYGMGHMFSNQEFVGYGPSQMFSEEEFVGYGPDGSMYSEEFIKEFNIDKEKLYEYMNERHEERINYLVDSGTLTEEEGKEALENFDENYNSESNQFMLRGRGFGPGSCFAQ